MRNLLKYRPCELVQGKKRWYIKYYQTNPKTGKCERQRETHSINRIKSLSDRRAIAFDLMLLINERLADGYPFGDDYGENIETLRLKLTNILDSIEFALQLKLSEFDNDDSKKGYNNKVAIFKNWIIEREYHELQIKDFEVLQVREFLNYLLQVRKLAAVTYNSYIVHLRQIFKILEEQFYVSENPFLGHRYLKEKPTKIRLRFKENPRKRFIEILKQAGETWLLLAIVLQYYCFVRPKQLRLLKVSDIDFQKWTIEPPVTTNKSAKELNLVIPKVARDYLPILLRSSNQNLFLFSNLQEGPGSTQIGKSVMYRRHQKYLKVLKAEGHNIDGLTFYSWKDTGGHDMTYKNSNISIFDVQDRMNHSSPKTTKRYVASNDSSADFIHNEI
jgi:integrase